jgi:hypothetical protein
MGLGSGIRDPGFGIRKETWSGSRIRVQGSKRHGIPDPDPQHWINIKVPVEIPVFLALQSRVADPDRIHSYRIQMLKLLSCFTKEMYC